jgi:hypothetical protein
MTTFRKLTAGVALALASIAAQAGEKTVVEVWKSPTCGCCNAWIRHLQDNGFATKVNNVESTSAIRKSLGIAPELGSCHTAKVGGYAIEGHVPAKDIKRLLAEKPKAVGLAVPGMPVGSPGMEGPQAPDKYDVVLVGRDGKQSVYRSY